MAKKGQQGPITHPLMKKKSHFTILLKIGMFLRELGNETYHFYHLHTFNLKKA